MFNGIIFHQGVIKKIKKRNKGINLFLSSKFKISNKNLGMSISCDGVCLTLISFKNGLLEFYLSNETLDRSKFKKSIVGDKINLELPIKFGDKISGHLCQGHVDTVATVKNIVKKDKSYVYDFLISSKYKMHLVEKASILINGVSLTLSKITKSGFQIWIIPHTLKLTNLSDLKLKDL
jgi:Riboflavin synthase alpha chain